MKRRPWVYYIAAIVTAAMLPPVAMTHETRDFTLLNKYATKDPESESSIEKTDNPDTRFSVAHILGRPARLLFTEPLVFVATLLTSFSMGLIYLFTDALGIVYTSPGFDFTYENASLPFLVMAAGIILSLLPRLIDIKRVQSHTEACNRAELKLTGCLLGAPALAIGLWIFAWSIPPRSSQVHPIVSMIGLTMIGFAATEISYTLQGYLTDSYTVYAASALSGLACMRAVTAGLLPLAGDDLFRNLGNNLAGSLLAGVATIFTICPISFYFYGWRLRARSRFARVSTVGTLGT